MTSISVELVSAFTREGRGGNMAGVVFNADNLTDSQKLAIAQQVGYSETAFISNDNEADFELTFFTVTGEVDYCGHATLAAFSAMHQKGLIVPGKYRQKTKAGILDIEVETNGDVMLNQKLPEWLGAFTFSQVSELVGLDSCPLDSQSIDNPSMPITALSTGLPDLILPVPLGSLDYLVPDLQAMSAFCEKNKLVGFHAFELNNKDDRYTASCRNFAPLVGIQEESATGSSCGALACYLTKVLDIQSSTVHMIFEQGRAMNCQSEIHTRITQNNQKIESVVVGGSAELKGKADTLIVSAL